MTGISRIVNEDMFGRYCRIPTGASGNMHVYKIVSRIYSNSYCDVPLMVQSKETLHNHLVPVLLVIHCGIDESEVQRVALSDCEIVPAANVQEVRHGLWEWFEEWLPSTPDHPAECQDCGWRCSECKTALEDIVGGYWDDIYEKPMINYCPNCGAKMDDE